MLEIIVCVKSKIYLVYINEFVLEDVWEKWMESLVKFFYVFVLMDEYVVEFY